MEATFPHLALWQAAQFHLVGQSLDMAESITGADIIIPTARARWVATVGFALKGEAAALQWQGFLAQMQGRVGTTLVPARSRYRPKDGGGISRPFCDVGNLTTGQTMEHWGFANQPLGQIIVNQNAGLRATEIEVRYPDSSGLRPGHFFSLGDRLHRVRAAYWSRDTEFGPRYAVHFDPPLRAAVTAGATVEVNRPVCRMRMVTEGEGLFDHSLSVLPTVQVQFAEAL